MGRSDVTTNWSEESAEINLIKSEGGMVDWD